MQHRQLLLCALAALSPFSTAQTQHPGRVPLTPAGGDFDNTKGNLVSLEVGQSGELWLRYDTLLLQIQAATATA